MKSLLYIIRHGETDYNVRGLLQGQLNIPLNQNGELVAVLTAKALQDVKFDRVITSPLLRAYRTAELVRAGNRVSDAPIETDDRSKEFAFGEWEGRPCRPTDDEEMAALNDFFYRPLQYCGAPGGESTAQVLARTGEFLKEVANDPRNNGKTILISTHGGAMRALLNALYEDKEDFWHGGVPDNCAINILSAVDGKLSFLAEDAVFYDRTLSHNPYNNVVG